jgi:quercetin dioxygenase-like cupin family protein
MEIRRVVTGHDPEGKSVVISDGIAPRTHDFEHIPGFSNTVLWATSSLDAPGDVPTDLTPTMASLLPVTGGSAMFIVQFPPQSVLASIDPKAAHEEQARELPGLVESFDPNRPGFHASQSIDYVIILKGELYLELESGPEVLLRAGDVVIQNGTWHAWHNRSDEVAVSAAMSVGTRNAS